jgi:hypothetical protein
MPTIVPRRIFWSAAIALFCSLFFTEQAVAAPNLIQNGTFSQGITGWETGSSIPENVVQPASGMHENIRHKNKRNRTRQAFSNRTINHQR